jgi:hypothetical protein
MLGEFRYRLDMGGINAPGIHYNLMGKGQFIVDNEQPIDIAPHTLIIVPPMSPFRIEVAGKNPSVPPLVVDAVRKQKDKRFQVERSGDLLQAMRSRPRFC